MLLDDLLLYAALNFDKKSTEKDFEILHEYIQECLAPEERNVIQLIDDVKAYRTVRGSHRWNSFRLFAPILGIGLAATTKFPIFGSCQSGQQTTNPYIPYLSLIFVILCTLVFFLTIYRMVKDRPTKETRIKEKISRRVLNALEQMY